MRHEHSRSGPQRLWRACDTFTFPNAGQSAVGDCAGLLWPTPTVETVRRGETFTMTPGDPSYPVPQPTGPAVVIVSTQRTAHAGTRATYRAVQPGRVLLMIYHPTFCAPPRHHSPTGSTNGNGEHMRAPNRNHGTAPHSRSESSASSLDLHEGI